MTKAKVAIIGGGAAGIMLACHLDPELFDIHIYEKTSRLGRKLLVAGEGGFNLTYHEPISDMKATYLPQGVLDSSLDTFSNKDLRRWLEDIGIETYVGSSKRVFPVKGIKPYMVVDAMLGKLSAQRVTIHTNARWKGWKEDGLLVDMEDEEQIVKADRVVFALGGGSWAKTGSDGLWMSIFEEEGIPCVTLQASNCGWKVKWPQEVVRLCAGQPLKNISLSVGEYALRGELMITDYGLEGGAIYALANAIRTNISVAGVAELAIDLKPDVLIDDIVRQLKHRKKSIKHTLVSQLKVSTTGFRLLRHHLTKDEYNDPHQLGRAVKRLVVYTAESTAIDEAISTTGGLSWSAVDDEFQIVTKPRHFAIGEMLDWDTRTGGYLLQGCFSMGVKLARHLNAQS